MQTAEDKKKIRYTTKRRGEGGGCRTICSYSTFTKGILETERVPGVIVPFNIGRSKRSTGCGERDWGGEISTHGVVVSDVVEWVRVVVDGAVGQGMVHGVVLVSEIVDGGRGVTRVHRDRTGQWYAAAPSKRCLTAAAATALRGGRPLQLIVHRRVDGQRVRGSGASVVYLVPVVAQRRPGARFHFDVRHVRRRVRFLGAGALLIVRVRFSATEIRCANERRTILISTAFIVVRAQ